MNRLATAAVLLAWCLLALGDAQHAGYYSVVALALVAAGFAVIVMVAVSGVDLALPERRLLVAPALVCVGAAIAGTTRPFLYLHGTDLHVVEALSIAAAVAAAASCAVPRRWQRPAQWLVLLLAAATGVVTIVVIGDPHIDVWELLQQSSSGLAHGRDMYRQHWTNSTGLQAVYPYLPGTTVVLAPFRWVFGDVRFGLLLASLAAAWLVWRRGAPVALGALLLVLPGWPLLVNRSWTEPLLVLALAVAVFAIRAERPVVAVIALAAALACKQHVVLLLPLFAAWRAFGPRRTLAACGLAAAVVLPWLIAGPRDLWHDAVHADLALGVKGTGLDLPSLLLHHGTRVGFWLAALALAGAYLLVLTRLPRTPSGLALGCAVILWAFDLSNKQTFFNHYVLVLGLLVVALAAAPSPRGEREVSSRPLRPAPTA